MKRHINAVLLLALCCSSGVCQAQSRPTVIPTSAPTPAGRFDLAAPAALEAMRHFAEGKKVSGVALLAFFEGDAIQAWTSKMLVVGRVKDDPTTAGKGNNLLAIAYAKAAEMALTLKDSGSQVRPPMTGEFGWQGGVIARVGNGYVIAAFSGGESADDVAISRVGLARMEQAMKP